MLNHVCLIVSPPVASQWTAHLWKQYCGGRWGVWCGSRWRPLLLQCETARWSSVPPQTWESVQVPQPTLGSSARLAPLFQVFVLRIFFFFCISPSQGLCCSQDCGFKPFGQTCDPETDCQRASVCSGLSPHCPEPSAKENLTVCSLGTRVCLNGVSIIGRLHLTKATARVRCCTINRGFTKTRPHFYLVQKSKCNSAKFSLLTWFLRCVNSLMQLPGIMREVFGQGSSNCRVMQFRVKNDFSDTI